MSEKLEFGGRVALVTGASRGIGKAVAVLLARGGARVAVHYRARKAEAEDVAKGLKGGPHRVVQSDVADASAARSLVDQVARDLGGFDILVNNAGIFEAAPIAKVSYGEWRQRWDRTIAVNLTGPANLMYCAARRMMETGGGRIVNVGSRGAFRGEPDSPAYGASKAGLHSLGQSLAQALAPHKIYVMTVAPGWVETDMAQEHLHGPAGDAIRAESPMGRVATPEEVAEVVGFLASGRADFATGCLVDVNGASYLRT
ncbi:MAG: SDR family oxidoreductase [Candidatus Latescibacterota bacterium]|nr:MAG: SDR family oxidoreductase [Candidatus Latescibacterota bacterium]